MRLHSDSIFARLTLLIAAVLIATLAVSAWTLRAVSLQPGGEQIADLLAGQIVAQHALMRRATVTVAPLPTGATALDLRVRDAPPPQAIRARLPFLRRIEARLKQRLGEGTQMRVEEGAESRLWVSTSGAEGRWIGVAVPPFAEQATRLTLIVTLVATILVLVAATWFARSLARPIDDLAAQAQALLAGDTPASPLPARAPREVRILAQALRDAGAARLRAEHDRALMLAGLSHDLRTPLARLRLALELDPADAELRAGMERDVVEIDAILGQFIDFARGGAGDEPARSEDLTALLQESLAAERVEPEQWTLRGLDTPCRMPLYPLALRRAIANLLRNALRHGAPPYELELRCKQGEVCIVVRDRGPGVEPSRLPDLAQPFVRGDDARGGGGTGLGLAVVEQAARLHRGALRLAARDGGGFEAELRLHASA